MKIGGKRIPKGSAFLFLGFMAISLCLLLIVSVTRTERINNMSQNMMYSGHERNFYIKDAQGEDIWEDVMPKIAGRQRNFAIYLPMNEPEIAMRGICVSGRVEIPPMIEGKYFDYGTSWSDTPRIVLGRDFQEEIVERNGRNYYDYEGTSYEVLGVMGTREDSRLNHMALVDFRSAVRKAGADGEYVLDVKKKSSMGEIARDVHGCLSSRCIAAIYEGDVDPVPFIQYFSSSKMILDTMYVMILLSFSLSTVLVTFIWLRFRRSLFFAWRLCGYKESMKGAEAAKRYYLAAGLGFAAGLLLMALCSLMMEEIQLKAMDVLQAFGMTVGLGTIILGFCYAIERKKRKE